MAAFSSSSVNRAHAPSSETDRADRGTSATVVTRPRLFVIALFAVIAWLALAVWIGHEKGARRERTFNSQAAAHATQPAHVHR